MIKEVMTRFFDAYLVRRDLEGSLALVSEQVHSLGTGVHEVALNKEELRQLMKAEFQSIPGGFEYEMKDYAETRYTDDLYGVYCAFLISMRDESGIVFSFQTRLTSTLLRQEGQWQILNFHMSTPSDLQEEEEFFPVNYGRQAIGRLNTAASKKLVETMISMLPGGIMGGYLEPGFPLYVINDTMLRYLGYTYDELVQETGELMQKIIDPEDWERVERTIMEEVREKGEYEVTYRVLRRDGVRMWVNDRGHEITTDDGRKAMISVMMDVSHEVELQEWLRREAMEDGLTGLLNRKGAISAFEDFLSRNQEGALFLLDIDNFKHVNDTYGHLSGDRVLVALAEILKAHTSEPDIAARLGGDEFMLFLPGCVEDDAILERARSICTAFRTAGKKYSLVALSVSIGIAVSPGNISFDHLFRIADERLYVMKKRGKDGILYGDIEG